MARAGKKLTKRQPDKDEELYYTTEDDKQTDRK
jgi:hypothetical protein